MEEIKINKRNINLKTISLFIFYALAFFLPIVFYTTLPVSFPKGLLAYLSTALIIILWSITKILGKKEISFNPISISALAVIIVALASSLSTNLSYYSIIGHGFDVGTFASILFMISLMMVIPWLANHRKIFFGFFFIFWITFILLSVYHLLRLTFGSDFLSFGIFENSALSLIGNWNNLGIFFGLSAILSLISLELLPTAKKLKFFLLLPLAISLFFISLIYFIPIWIALLIVSGALFASHLLTSYKAGKKDVSKKQSINKMLRYPSLAVFIISIFFIFSGAGINSYLVNKFSIDQIEVRPNVESTFQISKQSLKDNPFFGVGPSNFVSSWLKYKPLIVNNFGFWNTNFLYGYGLIPTYLSTTGIIGFISWIILIILLIYYGIKSIKLSPSNSIGRYISVSLLTAVVYLWLFQIIYVPSIAPFTLAFIFSGVLMSVLYEQKLTKTWQMGLDKNKWMKILATVFFALIILVFGALSFVYIQKFKGGLHFIYAIKAFDSGQSLDLVESKFILAIEKDKREDLYYRVYADLLLLKINNLLNSELSKEEKALEIQTTLNKAISLIDEAAKMNPSNYENWMALGNIYESGMFLGIDGSYNASRRAYLNARSFNPTNPSIPLALARLEFYERQYDSSRKYIEESLILKNNLLDSYYLSAQIYLEEKNIDLAIETLNAAINIVPFDAGLFYNLGRLKFNSGDFKGAIEAEIKALEINSNFANARYILGLSLYGNRQVKESLAQFEELDRTNPGNAELALIIENLKLGNSPLYGIQ